MAAGQTLSSVTPCLMLKGLLDGFYFRTLLTAIHLLHLDCYTPC